jgi:hypothetical protein
MRVVRERTGIINLRRSFPAEDPLAQFAVRAIVLYSDLRMELAGINGGPWEDGDDLGLIWRSIYFVRTCVRTLTEVESLINQLSRSPVYWAKLRTRPQILAHWQRGRDKFKAFSKQLKNLRDRLGGHLDGNFGRRLVSGFLPGDHLSQEWSRGAGMRGTLAAGFVWLYILGQPFRDAEGAEAVKRVADAAMEPIVSAHVDGILALGTFLRLYMMDHPELHLDIQQMPFAEDGG